MSLINQMLRDLDARQSADGSRHSGPAATAGITLVPDQPRKKLRGMMILLSLGILLVAGYLAHSLDLNLSDKPLQRVGEEDAVSSSPQAEPAPQIAPSPADPDQAVVAPLVTAHHEAPPPSRPAVEECAVSRPGGASDMLLSEASLPPDNRLAAIPQRVESESTAAEQLPAELNSTTATVHQPNSLARPMTVTPSAMLSDPLVTALIPLIVVPERVEVEPVATIKPAKSNISAIKIPRVAPPVPSADEAQELYQQAIRSAGSGQQVKAIRELHAVLDSAPLNIEAYHLLALLYLRTGGYQQAVNVVENGLTLRPAHPALITLRARLHAEAGEMDQAQKLLELNVIEGYDGIEALELLASIHQQMTAYAKAAAIYQRITRIAPEMARGWAGLAIAQDAQGQGEAALSSYRQALRFGELAPAVISYVKQRIAVLARER